ncbi:hypothetical protein QBC37DRAFT_193244 [Rhypophila decipiens]|uniref:Uncharacterized protein n=1 Tax=Rhypophila decipiens TaxID=261697 RepID=A0AAN6YAH1_9PEZI|nr:hypothetical protein QBC37DRAFT_193244 [Rhypophila decipiens]
MVDAYLTGDGVVPFVASCLLQRLSAQDDAALDTGGFIFGSLTALPRSTVTALAVLSLTLSPALGTPHVSILPTFARRPSRDLWRACSSQNHQCALLTLICVVPSFFLWNASGLFVGSQTVLGRRNDT